MINLDLLKTAHFNVKVTQIVNFTTLFIFMQKESTVRNCGKSMNWHDTVFYSNICFLTLYCQHSYQITGSVLGVPGEDNTVSLSAL